MITAVDTSILLDIFGADPIFGPRSKEALRTCLQEGHLIACGAVWAEVSGFFPSAGAAQEAMNRLGVAFDPIHLEAVLSAGTVFRIYRRQGGRRTRVVADFLIGAHAAFQSDRLLTRDRGFYRNYFSKLKLLDPSQA